MDMILTGRAMYPDEAMALHLANRRASKGSSALDEAIKLAETLWTIEELRDVRPLVEAATKPAM